MDFITEYIIIIVIVIILFFIILYNSQNYKESFCPYGKTCKRTRGSCDKKYYLSNISVDKNCQRKCICEGDLCRCTVWDCQCNIKEEPYASYLVYDQLRSDPSFDFRARI
ncbi:MAG: hypothetical protein QW303_04565 [Nitrososphaerota archaeon]